MSGVYLANEQVLVRQRSVNSDTGYLVLTPLHTTDGPTLLVVRGFISATSTTNDTRRPSPPPPTATVDITARVEPTESRDDQFAALHNGQVESINPASRRRGWRPPSTTGTPTWCRVSRARPG